MKPRVWSGISTTIGPGGKLLPETARREWIVRFDDGCGPEDEYFTKFSTALRFAYHVGCGGSRWEFVA